MQNSDDPTGMISYVTLTDGYAAWAHQYDQIDNPLVAMSSFAMKNRLTSLHGARVLELGCGTGRNVKFFLEAAVAQYVGIDNSIAMLEVAKAQYENESSVVFIEASVSDPLPESIGTFDIVFLSLVLEHLPAVVPALQTAATCARLGAQLYIYELHPFLHRCGIRAHVNIDGQQLYLPSYLHDEDEFRSALMETGWMPATVTSWYATGASCELSKKLQKHIGRPVLLEVVAYRA